MALKVHDNDNVATVFVNIVKDTVTEVTDKRKNVEMIKVKDDIPYGHKFAIVPIKKGDKIIKYGEVIGLATQDITVGEHVHVHNVESARGRGDWEKGDK